MSDQLRIGDAERERAQTALADHYAAGRLDHDEYTERLDRIWAARTQADLDPVFRDLPGQRAATTTARPRPRVPAPLLVLLVVVAALTVATHLPIILVGLAVWFLVLRGGCRPRSWSHRRW